MSQNQTNVRINQKKNLVERRKINSMKVYLGNKYTYIHKSSKFKSFGWFVFTKMVNHHLRFLKSSLNRLCSVSFGIHRLINFPLV